MSFVFSFQFGIYFVLFISLSRCDASPLTWEQRVEQLEQNNVDIKTQMSRLEEKVESQELQINSLTEKLAAAEEELIVLKNESSSDECRNRKKNAIYRTCHEAHAVDSSLKSGMHWIDPDGKDVGNDPIRVHCNMTTGVTSILHDSESETDVGRCAKRGCYSREIKYDASDRQIAALAELSAECHQSIKYDCVNAPLNVNGIAFSWWNDRNGIAQYFWSSSNSSVQQPVCQCGIDGNCFDDFLPCNCDSFLGTQLSDSGIITNKDILPVTRLNFGRLVLPTSSGAHTLGRFECSGALSASEMELPGSCVDLWRIGHKLSGIYSVAGTEKVESVYCDFTKRPADSQTRILLSPTTCSTSCGTCSSITNRGGIIQSNNYPGEYGNGLNCIYSIGVPSGLKIQLTFTTFSVEKDNDKVYVFEGLTTSARSLLGTFTGNFTGSTTKVTSTSNSMTVHFTTDQSVSGRWQATYVVV